MVLDVAKKAIARQCDHWTAMTSPAMRRILALVDEYLSDGRREMRRGSGTSDVTEVLVVASGLACQHRPEGMVEVITPLCVQSVAASLACRDQPRIVQVALCNHEVVPARVVAQGAHLFFKLLKEMLRRAIDKGVDR